MWSKTFVIGTIGVVICLLLATQGIVLARSLNPSAGPTDSGSQMFTLEQNYDRLNAGALNGPQSGFTKPASGSVTGTAHELDEIMAQASVADNANGATATDVQVEKMLLGLRAVGTRSNITETLALRAAPPCFDDANRYVDCENGTVTDTVTGLIWLKNAGCLGSGRYAAANSAAAGLQTGVCGLTDNSSPGDWRLPTKTEWQEMIARAVVLGCTGVDAPSLTNTPGTGCFSTGPQPFTGVQPGVYWTSTTSADFASYAWAVRLFFGVGYYAWKPSTNNTLYVWPVRGGQ